jgi:predicted transcriptional regulator
MAIDVATLGPDDSVEEAARLMRDKCVGFAPVVSNGMVLGVLTDRDIVVRAAAKGHHLKVAKVLDILTPGAVHCREDDDVKVAAGLMAEYHVRRVIVVKPDNRLAGVLSLSDLAVHSSETAKAVEDILGSSPFVEPEAETSMRGAGVSETGEARALSRRSHVRSLVRRELSAIEIYKLALSRVGRDPAGDELWRIEREHEQALDLLLADLRRRGEPSPTSSGMRGAWSKVVEAAAMIRGSKAAIKALRERERRGLHDYEDALMDDALDPEVKSLIRARLLPQARAHIPALDRVLEMSA